MTTSFRSECPIAASLDILGDRWTLVVLRDMLFRGRTRFGEFAADESIATNVLTERLNRLVECGLVEKSSDPDDGRRMIYHPLPPAIDLVPVLAELVAWGSRHTGVPQNPAYAAFANPATRQSAVADVMARWNQPSR